MNRILETKRDEVARAREAIPLPQLCKQAEGASPPRDFGTAVTNPGASPLHLIAEIKQRSPSAGMILERREPASLARVYHRHGASAISVLTDETYFGGRLEHIAAVKEAVPLPVLRKEFIVDAYQVYESRVAGADAVLLIAEVLGAEAVATLHAVAENLGMAVLVEVHMEENLKAVLARLGPPARESYLLGINNRDLASQRTDVGTTLRLSRLLHREAPFVCESGITSHEDVQAAARAGACAVLIGESILRAKDIGSKIDELLGRQGGSG